MKNNVTLMTTAALIVLTGAVEGTAPAEMIGQFVDTFAFTACDVIATVEKSPEFNTKADPLNRLYMAQEIASEIGTKAAEAGWKLNGSFLLAFAISVIAVASGGMKLDRAVAQQEQTDAPQPEVAGGDAADETELEIAQQATAQAGTEQAATPAA